MDLSHRVENQSWATTGSIATTDRYGNDVALVVAKMAYAVSPAGRVKLDYRPVRWTAVPDGHGATKYPSDLAVAKPGTDVGLVGTAHPPRGKEVARFMAWIAVDTLRKVVQVVGARTYRSSWGKIAPDDPAPAAATPLRYDQCFGGTEPPHGATEHPSSEPHNPVGVGFASEEALLLGRPAPRLEPVNDPLARRAAHASHGCFAPIPEHWEPRRALIGTRDAEWNRTRAPTPPTDFDDRFWCWATPELHRDNPLVGDEPIEVAGVLPQGTWRFQLPRYEPTFGTPTDDGWHRYPTHLDGILIDADAGVVELTWRAAIPLPTPWERLERIRVWSDVPLPREIIPAAASPTNEVSTENRRP